MWCSITTIQKKKEAEHDLRIATIFTYGSNEDSDEARMKSRGRRNTIGRQNQEPL
jgi:hypothetical protein